MTSRSESQNATILKHLKRNRTLSPLEALKRFGVMRLAARIYELRNDGHLIGTRLKQTDDGVRFAEYYLALLKEGK